MLRSASVRSQLLALFGLAVLPAVVLSAGLTWHGYRAMRHTTDLYQRQTTSTVANQVQSTIAGANLVGYTLLATGADAGPDRFCDVLKAHVQRDVRVAAYGYFRDGALVCVAGDASDVTAFTYDGLLKAAKPSQPGSFNPEPHLAAVTVSEATPHRLGTASFRGGSDVLLTVMSQDYLDRLINRSARQRGGVVSLLTDAHQPISHNDDATKSGWLPRDAAAYVDSRSKPFSGVARNGDEYAYVSTEVAPGVAHVMSGVRQVRFGNAEQQLAIGLAVPLLIFAIVMAVAWLAIDRLFLQWMRRLARTANRLSFGDFNVRAALPPNAPLELRQYADAFDQMTEVLAARTRELATVANQRSALLKELHHRVKNNFQVIASFLNLTKRQKTGEAYEALALSECRVHAMATAYKLALADGDISHAALGPLVTEVLAYVQQASNVSSSAIVCRLPEHWGDDSFLELDRAIPMALLLVEVMWPLLDDEQGPLVRARLEFSRVGDHMGMVLRDMNAERAPRPGLAQAQRMSGRLRQAFISQLDATPLDDACIKDICDDANPGGRVTLAISIPVLNDRHVT